MVPPIFTLVCALAVAFFAITTSMMDNQMTDSTPAPTMSDDMGMDEAPAAADEAE
jgi:hypothetical protein